MELTGVQSFSRDLGDLQKGFEAFQWFSEDSMGL